MKKKAISLLLVMLLVFSLLPMAALAEDGQAEEDDGAEFGVYDDAGDLIDEDEQDVPEDDPGEGNEPQQPVTLAEPEKPGEGEKMISNPEEPSAPEHSFTVSGVLVSIEPETGAFPEGAVFSVSAVPDSDQTRVGEAVESRRAENVNVAASYTFDIKVLDPENQTELQPAESKKVRISFALDAAANEKLSGQVYHLTENEQGGLSATALTPVQEQEQAKESVTVETDSFSLFTVEFTYGPLKYELTGGSSVELSEILAALGLSGTVSSVQVSDPSRFSASNESGKWVVTSLGHFEGEEKMQVTIDGVTYEIAVTSVETVSIGVSKVWDDKEDTDKLRPAAITVQLLADGEAVSGKTVTMTAESRWEDVKFDGLPKYKSVQNADGTVTKTEIRYSVEEAAVEHYISVVEGTAAEGFVITNYQTISVSVQKVWNDVEDLSGFRPSSVTVHLFANGVDTGLTATITKTGGWKHSFENLPKYDDKGEAITYTVQENAVAHYTTTYGGSQAEDFVITNTHVPQYVTVNVRKVWSDRNNANRVRPSSITVTLFATYGSPADTVEYDSATLSAETSWRASFTRLPKYLEGTAVTYTVEENRLSNYIPTITSTSTSTTTTYVITNTLRSSPGTGDNSHLGVWGSLLGISLLGMAALAPRALNRAGRRKNRG